MFGVGIRSFEVFRGDARRGRKERPQRSDPEGGLEDRGGEVGPVESVELALKQEIGREVDRSVEAEPHVGLQAILFGHLLKTG